MVRFKTKDKGVTLVELAVVTVVLAVLVMIAWTTWEMSQRETSAAQARTQAYQNSFAVMQRIKHDIMLATSIQIPDPDYAHLDSIQVRVSTPGSSIRRAFRLVDEELIIDLKDELAAPFTAFDGISGLEFSMLDSPVNSMVQITCTSQVRGQEVRMETVTQKRN